MSGIRLKKLRDELGLTQKELAEKLGFSQSYIAEIEKGKKEPSRKLLLQLKSLYAINVEWFLFGEGPMFKSEEQALQARIQELEAELKKMEEVEELGEDIPATIKTFIQRLQDKIGKLETENTYLKVLLEAYKTGLKNAPNSS